MLLVAHQTLISETQRVKINLMVKHINHCYFFLNMYVSHNKQIQSLDLNSAYAYYMLCLFEANQINNIMHFLRYFISKPLKFLNI